MKFINDMAENVDASGVSLKRGIIKNSLLLATAYLAYFTGFVGFTIIVYLWAIVTLLGLGLLAWKLVYTAEDDDGSTSTVVDLQPLTILRDSEYMQKVPARWDGVIDVLLIVPFIMMGWIIPLFAALFQLVFTQLCYWVIQKLEEADDEEEISDES